MNADPPTLDNAYSAATGKAVTQYLSASSTSSYHTHSSIIPDMKLPLIQSLINLGVVFRVGNKLSEAEARLAIAFRIMVGAAVDEQIAPVTATPEAATS